MKQNRFFLNRNAQEEGELWNFVRKTEAYARKSDPETSQESAKRVHEFLGAHHKQIYEALKRIKNGTMYEISEACDLEPPSVWRRLNELEKRGLIRTTGDERLGPSGRKCRVWEVV